jgi:hypothetical protein
MPGHGAIPMTAPVRCTAKGGFMSVNNASVEGDATAKDAPEALEGTVSLPSRDPIRTSGGFV